MKSTIVKALSTAILLGITSASFGNEAQPELQPTPVERGWFKRPADASRYIVERGGSSMNAYQFLNEASPL